MADGPASRKVGESGGETSDTSATTANANAQQDDFPATSYLFEDPHALPDIDIPEMQKLTTQVPARDQISIIIGPFAILFCDLVIPCIIYYSWRSAHAGPNDREYDEEILGYAVISFGIGEAYILVIRVYRLIKYREECGPLLSQHWWELDATSWIYAAALIAGLIPFVVGSALAIPQLYLYAPGIYMAFLGSWALLSLIPFKLPVRVNSEPRGSVMRPLVFYAAEDFFAVDGWLKRDFRIKYRQRYERSKKFRRMILYITLWWILGICTYLGCLSAVIWALDDAYTKNPYGTEAMGVYFNIAFGVSLAVLFSFIIIWAICTYIYIQFAIEWERQWWIKQKHAQEEKA